MASADSSDEDNVVRHEMGISVTGVDETRRLIGDEETILLVREKFRWAAEEIVRSIRQGSLETHRTMDEDGREVIHITKMPKRSRSPRPRSSR